MGSYDRSNVYNKIDSLEDKVNRLEEIISYGYSEDYSSTPKHYNEETPPHYKSAVRLSKATQNFKQDLIQNPRHNKLSRENYQQIYDRVSVLEKELNDIVKNITFERSRRSNYSYISYSDVKSQSYDDSQYLQGSDIRPKRRIVGEPQRKHIKYNKYVELIPSESSSSETIIEEIVYYIESSSSPVTSSSSSSVIVEEYIPKSYTRRSVRREPPFFDVSKSKPRPRKEKSPPQPKTRRKKKPVPEISVSKQPKVGKSNKENKIQEEKSDSESVISNEKSEIYLVKRSKESPTNTKKNKNEKNEKFFVSRLKKVKSSDDERNNKNINREMASSEQEPPADKKVSKSEKRTFKYKERKGRGKSGDVPSKSMKSKKRDKRKASKKSQSPKKSMETITVARSSFILNDPFVRTIYYDELDSIEEETKTNYTSNNNNNKLINKSEAEGSVYEMNNSIYSFDRFLKRKEKIYPSDKLNDQNLSQDSNNTNHGKNKLRIHNVNKNDIIVLNDEKLKPHLQKFTFKQRKKSKHLDGTGPDLQKENDRTDINRSSYFEEKNNSIRNSSPVAHSVYLTTVPVYQTNFHDFQLPTNAVQSSSKHKNISISLEIPSPQKSVMENEILINVARKLSPVVAKIINTQYLNSQDKYKTRSETSIISYKSDGPIDNFLSGNSSQTKFFNNNSNPNLLPQIIEKKSKEYRYDHHNSSSSENEIFVEVINSSDINRKPVKHHIYVSRLEDNSPYHQKPSLSKTKKGSKTSKLLTNVSRMYKKKDSQLRFSINPSGKELENLSENRDSVVQQQRGSEVNKKQQGSQISKKQQRRSQTSQIQGAQRGLSQKQQRGSRISKKQHRGSQIGKEQPEGSHISQNQEGTMISQKEKVTSPQNSSNSEGEEDGLTVLAPSQNYPSRSTSQSIQSKNSIINKPTSQSKRKKSISRIFSNKTKSIEKMPKNYKEPKLVSILSKVKFGNRSSKVFKQEQSQEVRKPSDEFYSTQNSEEHSLLSKIYNRASKNMTQNQSQEARNHSKVSTRQELEQEPALLNRMSSNRASKHLTQDQRQEARNQSKVNTRQELEQEPSLLNRMSSNRASKYLTQDQSQEARNQSLVNTRQALEQEPALLIKMNGNYRASKYLVQDQSQETHRQSNVNTRQELEQEPALLSRMSSNRASKYLTRNQSQEARNQSEVNARPVEQEPAFLIKMNGNNRGSKYFSQDQSQEVRTQSIFSPREELQQELALLSKMKEDNRASKILTEVKNQEEHTLLKENSSQDPMIDVAYQEHILNKLGAAYNDPEIIRLSDKSENERLYSGSREFLNNVKSVSAYYESPKSLVKDNNVEIREESSLSNVRLYQPDETALMETSKQISFDERISPEIIEQGQTCPVVCPIKPRCFESCGKPRTCEIQELQHKPMKPLEFHIHFSKEKRSKFESQSTLSLDNILSSQCKKVYSTEDLSLSEYTFDNNTESYKYRKIRPKEPKQYFKRNAKIPVFAKGQGSNKYCDYFTTGVLKGNCFSKTSKISKSEQLITGGSYYVDWHKVANEIKKAK